MLTDLHCSVVDILANINSINAIYCFCFLTCTIDLVLRSCYVGFSWCDKALFLENSELM
ncbi:hypothetical protein GQ55_8G075800 [Panicum hallii var. hallii]|uniref:Uncharacterized protein n=1 Tax=Panicum hallii var. hallii TaxID=1504633 RepID=A0A2T7CLQ9_9POAL|nr:hypothetical protein GQ55_8G075800 [Panicum hallii var. hallii]